MTLREKLENTTDLTKVEATDESYIAAIESLAKYFLKGLDNWEGFDKDQDWKESNLGDELYTRCEQDIPEFIKQELTGNQVGMAAHLAYQAYVQV